MKEANMTHGRASRRKNDLIRSLSEIEIIDRIEPSIEELRCIKPAMLDDTPLRVYIKK